MAKKNEQLLYLIFASVVAVAGVVCMIIATVMSLKLGKTDYAHSVEIEEINTQLESVNGVTYHIVSLDGDICNNTVEDLKTVSVEITFSGVDNKSGQPAEFSSSVTLENLYAGGKVSLDKKTLKVGNQRGFIPESIKSVRIILADGMVEVPYEETNDGNLLLFGGALVCLFVAGLLFAKWNNKRKSQLAVNQIKE